NIYRIRAALPEGARHSDSPLGQFAAVRPSASCPVGASGAYDPRTGTVIRRGATREAFADGSAGTDQQARLRGGRGSPRRPAPVPALYGGGGTGSGADASAAPAPAGGEGAAGAGLGVDQGGRRGAAGPPSRRRRPRRSLRRGGARPSRRRS